MHCSHVAKLLFASMLLCATAGIAPADTAIDDCSQPEASVQRVLWDQAQPLLRDIWRPSSKSAAERAGEGSTRGTPAHSFLSTDNAPEADGPADIAYSIDGTQVMVVHRDTDNVTFLNVNTRTVTHTVAVGEFPADIAVTPNGQFAVTANVFGNSLSIIDIASHSLVAHVPISGQQPYSVQITPDSAFAVVGVINDAVSSSFSVVNLATQAEVFTFPSTPQGVIGFFFTPEAGISGPLFTQFGLTPDGNTIVLPNRAASQVVLYNRHTGAATVLNTPANPMGLDISADGTTAVIAHGSPGNAISKINLSTQTVTASFPTTTLDALIIRITPDKSHAIAAISNNVIFVNLTTGAVAATIMTGVVGEIEISFDGQYAFVSNFNSRVIRIADRTLVATVPLAACVEAATSPVALRAVALNSRFREDVHFYNINGAGSVVEGLALTGPVPEGDGARNLAVSSDGQKLLVCHNTSRNVAVVDLPTQTVQSYVDVGDRPLAAAIAPNGQHAVICASDADAVRVMDLSTNAIVASIPIFSRPAQVRISPNSQWAYVLNVAGTDNISFIQLNGAASSLVSQVSAGQTGSAQGYAYTEVSGIELSDDGGILAVCDSFNDLLRLYNTATRTQIAAVPVGDFPMRVAFNPAGTRAFVANAFTDNVSIVNVNGASSSVIGTISGIEFPLIVEVDAAGAFAYVGNSDSNNPRLYVINAMTNTLATSIALPGPARDSHYSADDGVLYLALNNSMLARVQAAGASTALIDTIALASGPSQLAFCDATDTAITAQPIPDGVDIITFGPTQPPCPADIVPPGGDGTVNVNDLLAVINQWGTCPVPPADCPADITPPGGDGVVNVNDLLAVINAWGPCPGL